MLKEQKEVYEDKIYQLKLKRNEESRLHTKVKKNRNSLIKRFKKTKEEFQQQLSNQFKETQEYAGQILILKNKVDKLAEENQFLKASKQPAI